MRIAVHHGQFAINRAHSRSACQISGLRRLLLVAAGHGGGHTIDALTGLQGRVLLWSREFTRTENALRRPSAPVAKPEGLTVSTVCRSSLGVDRPRIWRAWS